MNKDLTLILSIIVLILVSKKVCGRTREGFACDKHRCAMDLCTEIMDTDPSNTPQEIVSKALADDPLIGGIAELVDSCKCDDKELYKAALIMKNFEKKQGQCIKKGGSGSRQQTTGGRKMGSGNVRRRASSRSSSSSGGFGSSSGGGCRSKNKAEVSDRECQTCIDMGGSSRSELPLCKNNCTGCR